MSQYMTDYVENLEKLNEAKIQRISELERENAALRAALDLTTDRLVFYMQNIPIAYKDYIKTNEGEISYSIVNSSLSLLKKEATL